MMTEDEFEARQAQLTRPFISKRVLLECTMVLVGSLAAIVAQKKDLEQGWPGLLGAFLGLVWVLWLSSVQWFGLLYMGCFVFRGFRECGLFGQRLLEEEASRAASLLVWSKRDDGSSTLISVPFNVDGTRGEAPQHTISNVLEGIAALSAVVYTVGVALGLPPY